jgi:uncharacterized protein (TIGR02145 family)
MVVYNTATAGSGATAVVPGIYINDGTSWRLLTAVAGLGKPVALNVRISGTVLPGSTLSSGYTYSSPNGAAESGTTYQWYRAADNSGITDVPISGATASTYTVTAADAGAYIRVGITPGAATGPTPGATAYSGYLGPVQVCGTATVKFIYNGAVVTYGTIASPNTGVCYLDRNLGAAQAATSSTDYQGYGDLFQWGRLADGHQLITWTSSTAGTAVNGMTTTLSTTDVPGNNLFIQNGVGSRDWRSTQNNGLWQGTTGVNNPCPSGWYVPTQTDWTNETTGTNPITSAAAGFTNLKLTTGGYRSYNGSFADQASYGDYWSSTVNSTSAFFLNIGSGTFSINGYYRSGGFSVRCRK